MIKIDFSVPEKELVRTALNQFRSSLLRSVIKERHVEVIRLRREDMKTVDAILDRMGEAK